MDKIKRAKLVLEDGAVFKGLSFGAEGISFGEVIFNTSMAGYQEILTDPSYKGQIVTMTYPLIGNYGVNPEDVESRKLFLEGFVVKEASRIASNWRSKKGLGEYLKENNIVGIEGIDTRALTRRIRLQGAMKAAISTDDVDDKALIEQVRNSKGLLGVDLVKEVTIDKPYNYNDKGDHKVVVLDCGVKLNILRELSRLNCHVTVVPVKTSAKEILGLNPDGILLSNGPGDPAAVTCAIETVKELIKPLAISHLPFAIMGICLGHQILGLALGGKTYKLKFGHHGANHPVKDLNTNKVSITSQNHGFCVDMDSLPKDDFEITHVNLNDQTLEGIRHKKLPIFSVQFHPESAPGPHDARYLFGEFINLMKKNA
ncbi:MAG: glutamine-hydrolyzing carbamoyl-phosphate synthase small subunit [Candidatus Omnitrophota bacterium]